MKYNATYRITILKRTDENDSDRAIYILSKLAQTGIPFRLEEYKDGFLQNAFTKACSLINNYHLGENVNIQILDLSDKIVYEEFENDIHFLGFEKALDLHEQLYGGQIQ